MASQDGQLGGLPVHSDVDTALSGANSFSQDGGVAVESPFDTDSQASVALAGEHSLPHAAGSTVHTSAHLLGNNSAMSVTAFEGKRKGSQDVQRPALSSSLNTPVHSRLVHLAPLNCIQQQAGLPSAQQEPGNPTDAATAVPSSPGQLPQSPFPHCKLASAQQRASAAASVEAVQQEDDDDEDDVQGNLTSQTGRGVSSTPTTSSAQRPKPNSLYGILPVAPTSRQRMPAFYNAADRSGLEHALSGMCDSEYQHHPASPASQQLSGISHTQRNHKRHKADSGEVLPALRPASALLLAPECSGASQGCSQAASQQGICQAAPETTQQATIEEALSGQPYDEDAQQSAYSSPAPTGVSLGAGAANSPVSQPSGHVSAQALAAVQHFVSAEVYAGDASVDVQQQTTASNDGLVAAGSYDTQQDAAASVHATALEGNLPGSDGETDLSSVGWQTGKQPRGRGSRHRPRLPRSADSPVPDVSAQSRRSHFGNSQATSQRQI